MSILKVMPLEERIVLDGAIAVDIAAVAAPEPAGDASNAHLVVISEDIADSATLIDAVDDNAIVLVYDPGETDLNSLSQQINEALGENKVQDVSFVTDGSEGFFSLVQSHNVTTASLENTVMINFWQSVSSHIFPDGNVNILGCNVAGDDAGIEMLEKLDSILDGIGYNIDVNASVDLTGHSDLGGNWSLEFSTDTSSTPINLDGTLFNSSELSQWDNTLVSVINTTVFRDLNGNGIQDGDDPGIQGIRVNLYDATDPTNINVFGSGVLEASVITDSNGLASFTGIVAPDTYVLEWEIPIGHTVTTPDQGGNDNLDSDASTTVYDFKFVRSPAFSLADGTTVTNIDVGFTFNDDVFGTVSIGDTVWNDINQDGIQDGGEPGLNGVEVTLNGQFFLPSTSGPAVAQLIPLITTTTPTDGSTPGDYLFTDIIPLQSTLDIIFVVDSSGSTGNSFSGATVGDVNNDGLNNRILDSELAAISILTDDLINKGFDAGVRIGLMEFNTDASAVNMGPSGTFDTLTPSQISDGSGNFVGGANFLPGFKSTAINTVTDGGGTDYGDAFAYAIDYFNAIGTQPENGILIFLTDGQPNSNPYASNTDTLRNTMGIDILALGVGSGANMNTLRADDIDPRAEQVLNEPQLFDYFNGFLSFALSGYSVGFEQPSGFEHSPQYATGATTPEGSGTDSDPDSTTGLTDVFTVSANTNITTIDAGMVVGDILLFDLQKSAKDILTSNPINNLDTVTHNQQISYTVSIDLDASSTVDATNLMFSDVIDSNTTLIDNDGGTAGLNISVSFDGGSTFTPFTADANDLDGDGVGLVGNSLQVNFNFLGISPYTVGDDALVVTFDVEVNGSVPNSTHIFNTAQLTAEEAGPFSNLGPNPDIIYLIDVSGSTEDPFNGAQVVGDINNDGISGSILDAQLAALIDLTTQLNIGLANGTLQTSEIAIVTFTGSAITLNVNALSHNPAVDNTVWYNFSSPEPNSDYFTSSNSNINIPPNVLPNTFFDINEILRYVVEDYGVEQAGGDIGGTDYFDAIDQVIATFQQWQTDQGFLNGRLIMVSDGAAQQDATTAQINTLDALGVTDDFRIALGIGSGANLSDLQIIDADAFIVTDYNQLTDFFGTIISAGNSISASSNTLEFIVDGVSDITVQKSSTDTNGVEFLPGDTVLYTINIENTGQDSATDVTFTDTIPSNTTFVASSVAIDGSPAGTLADFNGTALTVWLGTGASAGNGGTLAIGEQVTVTFSVTIDDPTNSGTTITNTANVNHKDGTSGVQQPTDSDSDTFDVDGVPDLTVQKSSTDTNGVEFLPGDTVLYTINIENTGQDNATNVVFTDTIPSNTTFVASSVAIDGSPAGVLANFNGTSITVWLGTGASAGNGGTLAVGEQVTVTFSVTIDDPTDSGTTITNTANINHKDGTTGLQQPTDSDSDSFDVDGVPDLTVQKSSTDTNGVEYLPGDTVLYTINIENTGQDNATNVTFTDTIPSNTTFVASSVAIDGSPAGTLANFNGTAITVWLGTGASAGNGGTLTVGEQVTVTFSVTIDDPTDSGTTVTNTANVNHKDGTTGVQQPTDSDSDSFDVDGVPDLTVQKSSTDTNGVEFLPGDTVLYTINIENTGQDDATNVVFTDTIPSNTTFVASSVAIDGSPAGTLADFNGTAITVWLGTGASAGNGGTLAVGEQVTVTFSVTIDDPTDSGTTITNTANINHKDGTTGLQQPTDSDSDTFDVEGLPDLTVQKSSIDTNGVEFLPGDTILYTINIENTGQDDATDVTFTDTIPSNTTFVANSVQIDGSPAGTLADFNGTAITVWLGTGASVGNGGTLAVGEQVTVIFSVTIDDPTNSGTNVTNTANVNHKDGTTGLQQPTDSDSDSFVVDGVPDLTVQKSSTDTNGVEFLPGDTVLYTINIENTGQDDATNVVFTDTIPSNTTFVASSIQIDGSPAGTLADFNGTAITVWLGTGASAGNGGTLAVGEQVTVTFSVTIDNPTDSGTTITNTANVNHKDGTTGLQQPTDSDSDTFDVDGLPDLTVQKSSTDTNGVEYLPGDTILYTINIENTGQDNATDVVFTDTIPSNTTFVASSVAINGSPAGVLADFNGTALTVWLGTGASAGNGGTLAVGEQVTVTFSVTIDDPTNSGTTITNTANINHKDGTTGLQQPADSDSDSFDVDGAPDLTVQKSSTDTNGVEYLPGDTILYTINIENTGQDDATDVVFTDTIPSNTTFVTSSIAIDGSPAGVLADFNGTAITVWLGTGASAGNGGTLAVGEQVTVTFSVTIDDPTNSGTTITNTANVNHKDGTSGAQQPTDSDSDSFDVDGLPDLTVQKSSTDTNGVEYLPGDTILYTINIENTGQDNAANVTFTDTIPSNTTFVASSVAIDGSPAGVLADFNGTAITVWLGTGASAGNGGILAVGEQVTVTFSVTIDDPTNSGTTVTNTANVNHKDGTTGLQQPTDSDSDSFDVDGVPDLTIQKSSTDTNGVEYLPGDTILYTINIENTGQDDATDVVFTDTIPSNTTFVAGSAAIDGSPAGSLANFNGTALSVWLGTGASLGNGGTLAVGEQVTVTFSVTIDDPTDSGTTITNTANVNHKDGTTGLQQPTDSDSDSFDVDGLPDLTVQKSSTDTNGVEYLPGDTILYTINIENTGQDNAANVTFTDTIPSNTTFVASSVAIDGSPAGVLADFNGTAITVWLGTGASAGNGGTLAVGEQVTVTFSVTIDDPTDSGTTVTNTANVNHKDGTTGLQQPTDSDSDSFDVDGVPDLTVQKSSTDTNGVEFLPGDTILYTINIENTGQDDATDVVFTDTIPSNTTFVAGSAAIDGSPAGSLANFNGTALSVWLGTGASLGNGGTLAVGEQVTVTFSVTIDDPTDSGTTVTNTANVNHKDGTTGLQQPTDSDSDSFDVDGVPDLTVQKSSTDTNGVEYLPGDTILYTINIENTGQDNATNVTFTDTIPSNTTFVASSVAIDGSPAGVLADFNGTAITVWLGTGASAGNGGTLSVGEQVTVTFSVTIDDPTDSGTTVTNTANVNHKDGTTGLQQPTDSDSDSFDVDGVPDLTVQKSSTDTNGVEYLPGDTILYTINIENTGQDDATDVTFTDTIPSNTTFVASSVAIDGSPAGVLADFNGTAITVWLGTGASAGNGGTLSVGEQVTVTFSVTIDDPTDSGTTVTNTANVNHKDGTTGLQQPTDSDSDSFDVDGVPDLTVQKSSTDTNGVEFLPGDTILYTINIENTGQDDATDVTFTDTIPSNTTFVASSVAIDGSPAGVLADFNGTAITVWLGTGASAGNGGTLAVGEQVTVTFSVTIDDPTDSGTTVTNTANVNHKDGTTGLQQPTDSDSDSFDVDGIPDLTVQKSSTDTNGVEYLPGDTILYTINIENTGQDNATNVTFTDTIPSNTTFVASSVAIDGSPAGVLADFNGTAITVWLGTGASAGNGGTLAVGEQVTVTFSVTIDDPTDSGTTVTNTANVNHKDGTTGLQQPTDSDSDSFDVDGVPDLTVQKSSTDTNGVEFLPGDTILYTINIENTGQDDATDVVFTDTIPSNTTFVAGSAAIDGSPAGSLANFNGTALSVWLGTGASLGNGGTLAVGEQVTVTFSVTIDDPTDSGTTVTNTANVNHKDGTTGVQQPTDSDSDSFDVDGLPDLTVQKSSTDTNGVEYLPGDTILYTINIENTGQDDATDVTFTDTIPSNTTFVASSVAIDGSPAGVLADFNGTAITVWLGTGASAGNGGTLAVGEQVTVTFTVTIDNPTDSGTTVTNTANVNHKDGTTGLQQPTDSDSDTFDVDGVPDLTVQKSSTDTNGVEYLPGDTILYTINIENTGQDDATNVIFTDTIPSNTTFVTNSISINGLPAGVLADFNGTAITVWLGTGASAGNGGTLAVGEQATVTFSVTINDPTDSGTTITNTANVNHKDGTTGVQQPTDSDSDSFDVDGLPDLTVQKSSTDTNGIEYLPGDTILYTINIENTGQDDATDVTFTDTIPSNTTFVASSVAIDGSPAGILADFNGTAITVWLGTGASAGNGGTLAVGEQVTVTFEVTINDPTDSGTTVTNTANVNHKDGTTGLQQPTDSDSDTFDVDGIPDIIVQKTSTDTNGIEYVPGDTILYTITVQNTGQDDASDVIFIDTIPTHTTFVANSVAIDGSPAGVLADFNGTALSVWLGTGASAGNGGTLAVGEQVTVTFEVTINDPTDSGTTITNTANINHKDGTTGVQQPTDSDSDSFDVDGIPDLTVNKSNNDTNGIEYLPGDTILYTITVQNTGQDDSTDVTFTDIIPSNVTFVANSIMIDGQAAGSLASFNGTAITAWIGTGAANGLGGTLGVGEQATITFAVTIDAGTNTGTEVTNTANFFHRDGTTNIQQPTDSDTDTFFVDGIPDLIVNKSSTDTNGIEYLPGDSILYTITVQNSGQDDATDAIFVDTIPANTTFIANSVMIDGQPAGVLADFNGTALTVWLGTGASTGNGGTIAVGQQVDVTFAVTINDGTNSGVEITNTATINHKDGTTNLQQPPDSDSDSFLVDGIPDFTVNKTSQDVNGIEYLPGDTILYTITLQNTGQDDATNVTFTDTIPSNTTFVAGTIMINGQAAGSLAEFNGTSITAWLGTGASNGTGGTMSVGEQATITFEVTIDAGTPNDTEITNTANLNHIDGTTDVPQPTDSSSDTFFVDGIPDLAVTKTFDDIDGSRILAGDTVLYTITITNQGQDTADDVILIDDPIPGNTTFIANSVTIDGLPAGALADFNGTSLIVWLGDGASNGSGGTLDVGETITVSFQVMVNAGTSFGTEITNIARVNHIDDSTKVPQLPDTSPPSSFVVEQTPQIIVTPTSGLITTEGGQQAEFEVYLTVKPFDDVIINLASSDLTEGSIDKLTLTFTPNNWNTPQIVTITGVDDTLDDGDIPYTIVTSTATSSDSDYNDLEPDDVSVINLDNDDTTTYNPGITVIPVGPFNSNATRLITTETGGNATFTIQLNTQPITDVTIPLFSNDLTEGYTDVPSVTFTPFNWNIPQTVTVMGVEDQISDGNIPYTIVTDPAQTTDPIYNILNPHDVLVTNLDTGLSGKTVPGITVTPIGPLNQSGQLITTEEGGTATFTVALDSQPTDNVTISLTSDDSTEGFTDQPTIIFTPFNWNTPQAVTVTGVDDTLADGDINYDIITEVTQTNDILYKFIDPNDVLMVNLDDGDTGNVQAGVIVDPISGLITTEQGGTATFTVVLTTQPEFDVTIPITSNDVTEGVPDQSSLTFTVENWNIPQTVTVIGVDDTLADGDISYMIDTGSATGVDNNSQPYTYLNDVDDVSVTNLDDTVQPDAGNILPGVTVSPVTGLETTETGGFDTFTVALDTQPYKTVTITITSTNEDEGTVDKQILIFNPWDWNIEQTVTVTGVDNFIQDGDQPYTIVVNIEGSNDPDPEYNPQNIDPDDVGVINIDNDKAGLLVAPGSGLITSEDGDTDRFIIFLTSKPTSDVIVNVTSENPGEGLPLTTQYTFKPGNWFIPQVDTLEGQDDNQPDGDVPYLVDVFVNNALTQDLLFNNLSQDVSAINLGDIFDFNITFNPSPLYTPYYFLFDGLGLFEDSGRASISNLFGGFETGLPQSPFNLIYGNALPPVIISELFVESSDDENIKGWFEIYLTLKPRHPVTINFESINMPEGALSTDSVTFDPDKWYVVKKVYVTADADLDVPGDETQIIVTDPAISEDNNFDDFDPQDLNINQELEDKALNGNDAHPQE
jgi:uncharacterized repeat protein (TIGR01451 family)